MNPKIAINNDTLCSFITHFLVVALPKLTGGVKRCAHFKRQDFTKKPAEMWALLLFGP